MRRPSDYGHAYGQRPPSHWAAAADPVALPAGEPASDAAEPMELATFRLLYESDTLCLFETRDGHVTAVATDRLG